MYWWKCITWMHCKSLWIKASAKCINININIYATSHSGVWIPSWEHSSKWLLLKPHTRVWRVSPSHCPNVQERSVISHGTQTLRAETGKQRRFSWESEVSKVQLNPWTFISFCKSYRLRKENDSEVNRTQTTKTYFNLGLSKLAR